MRGKLCVALWQLPMRGKLPTLGKLLALGSLLALGGTAGCEAVWGKLAVTAAENCVLGTNPCAANQVCDAVTQLCQDAIMLSQITPARAKTVDQTPITITGANFVPGMRIKWNGVELSPVTVDSATQLRVTAPSSADGGWLVTLEVSNPSGATVSRSDLFSYYSTAVTFQSVTTAGSPISALLNLRIAPAARTGRPAIVYPDVSGMLHGVAVSNDGTTRSDQWMSIVPQNLTAMLVGDLNGDGVRDLMLASTKAFYWQAGNADSTFQSYLQLHTVPTAGANLALGDLDHDGHADLVGIDVTNKQLAILGNGGTQFSTLAVGGGLDLMDVAVGQLDGLPGDDLAVTYVGMVSHFSVIRGGATLLPYLDVPISPCQNGRLKAGSFGGANQALVLTCDDRVEFWQGTGGAFTAGFTWPVPPLTQKVLGGTAQLADFDGDGDLDAVVLRGPLTGPGALPAELWLFENVDGRGTLVARQLGTVTVVPSAILDTGDVNNDGKPDVVVGDRSASSPAPLIVLLNQSR